jgi:hypothetical protein
VQRSFLEASYTPLKPQPNLDVSPPSSIDIPPNIKKMPTLKIVKFQSTSIPPRPVYHPVIINACTAMFSKHPSQLTEDENNKFKAYRTHNSER